MKKIIGQIINDNDRDMIIIDVEYRKNNNNHNILWCKYHCNKCGAELWTRKSNLLSQHQKCACCSNKTVVKGINDIATTHPYLVKYFVNIEDSYNYTYGSDKKIKMKCPYCSFEKYISPNTLSVKGFSCPKCSDGISYPEKIMLNLLEQLKQNKQLDDFVYQYSKTNADWCGKYRYDFYFEKGGESYIIEVHGIQHYEPNRFNKSKDIIIEKKNDESKKELALKNGIKENNYIIIDCRKSDFDFIKCNILYSTLNSLFTISNVDWDKIRENCYSNKIKEICEYWKIHVNNNKEKMFAKNLTSIFNVSINYVLKSLKLGNSFGWCEYISYYAKHSVKVYKNGICLGIFESYKDLERKSEDIFGTKLYSSRISEVCNGIRNEYKGFKFELNNY